MSQDYNFMDNNPDNYPQKPRNGLTADQKLEIERSAALTYYFNGGGGSLEHIDGYAWRRLCDARDAFQAERLRNRLGREAARRQEILGKEAERRLEMLGREVERTRIRS